MINLYGHAGSKNHGCEALARSTAAMFSNKIKLFSYSVEQDNMYGLNEFFSIETNIDAPACKPSLRYYLAGVEFKTKGTRKLESLFRFQDLLSKAKKGDIYLSIGGDNYCYEGVETLIGQNYWLHKKGAKTVLWGCSVEPELVNQPELAEDFARYDLITARESISFEALKKVNKNTILVSDPAFTLPRQDLELPKRWNEGNMIGINVSPLIMKSAEDGNLIIETYATLMQYILDYTSYGIALIPHVVWENNNDLEPLKLLYNRFKDSNRIVLIRDCNCMELKGYIARCRFFIGARTHATIAAYSNCVPTLVLGYSVKSRGIARDLFGEEKNYVLPVQGIKDKDELKEAFQWLENHEDEIRIHLQKIMPDYINRAYLAKDMVEKMM
ncbi:polysaccharide pyruvyl transferase family protein [Anaerostipes butyraticus]|uniref:Polysaccharide pyruvyl transferase domain-containing protein n=1 Tax=Anaerostipes butyraticus TaxID=645466 RepID=A0A916Q8H2_9FIRM|nr:polysaccharide pyruvyl transferase family protein [Anaerostipes butyraticus]GFO86207.1 hypothetical protein ANBU17_25540 [Anaerostipes butyraticus]